jgi:hypothetical protein
MSHIYFKERLKNLPFRHDLIGFPRRDEEPR